MGVYFSQTSVTFAGDFAAVHNSGVSVIARCPQGESRLYQEKNSLRALSKKKASTQYGMGGVMCQAIMTNSRRNLQWTNLGRTVCSMSISLESVPFREKRRRRSVNSFPKRWFAIKPRGSCVSLRVNVYRK